MSWTAAIADEFEPEFDSLANEVQEEILAHAKLLERFGPLLGRPHVDTLKGSCHSNMKELRLEVAGGVWRVAFAFDPRREAILFVAGDSPALARANSTGNWCGKRMSGSTHIWLVSEKRESRHANEHQR